jgi:bifunctional non-homologous end joining protein LigD
VPSKPRRAEKASLEAYDTKRDFARTPEPKPGRGKSRGDGFVVQKHAARRLHYDLRLEMDGVLKSWAITRGPSLTTGEKRLAIRTEDHPLEYLTFEGNIPKGEYGGGSMIVWDRGRWTPEFDAHKGLEKGHLQFSLDGKRLKGSWHLVRIKPRRGERNDPWLLIKSEDEFARPPGSPEITDEETTSFASGLTTEELAAKGTIRADHKARIKVAASRKLILPDIRKVKGAKKGILPPFVEPSLAAVCDKPPSGANWVHEIKFDGYRIQARIDGGRIRLKTRKGLDWTDRFRSIAEALEPLGLASALLDGEVVVEDAGGIPSFPLLQEDLSAGRQDRLRYRVFDILYAEGFDLMPATLLERKALLQQLLAVLPPDSPVVFSEHIEEDGPAMLKHACRLGLEGIISKRVDLPYRPGRGEHWLKSKCTHSQEFLILGYSPSTVAAASVGALLLGYREAGKLHYAGRVGTGWSAEVAKMLRTSLDAISSPKPALANAMPDGSEKGVRWAEPKLICEVQYAGWSADRILRQSSFRGLREDKAAEEIGLEEKAKPRATSAAATLAGARLTHPERLLWENGVTKQGLAEFYAEIADWILPHIAHRVLSLMRRPGGPKEKSFFAKHPWAGLSDAVLRVEVGEKDPMLAVTDLAGLLNLVQAGVVEIHPWGSTADDLERPDRLIFDLDPGEDVPWRDVIAAAQEIRQRLEDLGLESFVKTTGGKGLHVVLPLEPRAGWEEAKDFTRSIAEAMAKDSPARYVATMSKSARPGRIFVDYFRNGRGATAVGAYSTRAFPNATVSVPLQWDELSEQIRSDHFRVDTLVQRLDFLREDPWREISKVKQRLPPERKRR